MGFPEGVVSAPGEDSADEDGHVYKHPERRTQAPARFTRKRLIEQCEIPGGQSDRSICSRGVCRADVSEGGSSIAVAKPFAHSFFKRRPLRYPGEDPASGT